jgi:hypothetical protein
MSPYPSSDREVTAKKLVDGETVLIANSVCRSEQTLVRLGKNLIAGIYNMNGDSAVYFWKSDGRIYRYIGDISVMDNEDGTALLRVMPGNGDLDSPLEKRSLEFHRNQITERARIQKNDPGGCLHASDLRFLVGVTGSIPRPEFTKRFEHPE